ncbi:hypothetical protein RB195_009876 [Necator americanus]|uniref:Uncharacterized protein n=1 Tax=Necator americanus TaxID=51031 RepID=A0ABR1CWS6_NECAM
MAQDSSMSQKGAVIQHIANTHDLKEVNCRTLLNEQQQAALTKLVRYLCVPFAALRKTRIRDQQVISIENNDADSGDADKKKVVGCATAVRNDYNNLVEVFGSTSS